ncbi:MAG: CoB--CoM heterodisulfide reductase iron-sulfur subunit A family protein [Candidatus Heimdallarchaeota archaeon]|nr:MAG: CoB--CoM heterodisulfide reductase iron-sulfur subunit A family protein [Candidatus Heimdallarchaeota archaeon]
MSDKCVIIGGEIAALRAAKDLATLGVAVSLINPSNRIGENSRMFQRGVSDFAYKSNIIKSYVDELVSHPNVIIMNNTRITKVIKNKSPFNVEIEHDGVKKDLDASTVIMASGFEIFNAEILEEYGYGILEGVMTIFDLENAFREKKLPINQETERVVFTLCVGSRILRDGANPDCSAYCCSYSINQALHIKREFPDVDVVVMYMDIRTIGSHEYLYNEARSSGVLFIRGRPSAIERSEDKLITTFEDTLANNQDLLPADIVILAVGGVPAPDYNKIASDFGVQLTSNGFVKITEKPVFTSIPGIFACGSVCDGVKNVQQSLSEGGAAAIEAFQFITEHRET